jgi:predicted nuclease of predicted toxin-antitoxin system
VPTNKLFGTPSAASLTFRPPEPLVFFVDESLDSRTVVDALRTAGASVERLTDHFPKGTLDETWLGHAGTRQWIVLTRDKRIRYRQLEKLALTEARVRAFVFTGGNVTMKDTASILVKALPHIGKVCQTRAGPFIYHIGLAGKPHRVT